jgi:mRNA interferase RelE/StbE
MASYRVEWKHSAAKELRALPREAIRRIIEAVERLQSNPYPPGVAKLRGTEHTYRMRVGDYRVLSSELSLEIIRVRHRKDAYRAR